MEQEEPKKNMLLTYTVMMGMLVFGSANILIQDAQNLTKSDGNLFTHPYLQCSFMFVGELSVFLAYGAKKFLAARKAKTGAGDAIMSPGATSEMAPMSPGTQIA